MAIINIICWLCLFIQPYMFCMKLEWGVASCKGKRQTMEDRHAAIINDSYKGSFFAVYDGHSGHQVAQYLQQEFYNFFLSIIQSSPSTSYQEALKAAFITYDARLRQKSDVGQAGSTAVVIYLVNNKAYIAWAGDSRAVVVRGNKIVCHTRDHKPIKEDNEPEYMRCKKNVRDLRLFGKLAVSRSFGDFGPVSSRAKHDDPYAQRYKSYQLSQASDPLIAEPEVVECDVQPGDIIVMACDGLWDVVSNEKLQEHLVVLSEKSDQQLDVMCDMKEHIKRFNQNCNDKHPCSNDGNNKTMRLWACILRNVGLRSSDNVTVSCIRIGSSIAQSTSIPSSNQGISNFLTRSNTTLAIALSVAVAGVYYLTRVCSVDDVERGDGYEDGDSDISVHDMN